MLSKKLKESRLLLGITQEQMASLLDISFPIYKFLEYGEPLWDTVPLERKVDEIVGKYKNNRIN